MFFTLNNLMEMHWLEKLCSNRKMLKVSVRIACVNKANT